MMRRFFRSPKPPTEAFTWQGVHESFAEVPSKGDPFREEFAQQTADATAAAMQREMIPRDGGLLTLLATEIAARNGRVSILDFGGAAGIDYVLLRTLTRQHPIELDYTVIDNARMCDLGRRIHAGDPSISFATDIDGSRRWDVVHASASLTYVNDWRTQLRRLIDRAPSHFLLFNTFAGEFPTFATAQINVPGAVIPCWFFSKDELTGLFDEAGYTLAIDVATGREYDQSNLPENRRAPRARNLVFRRLA